MEIVVIDLHSLLARNKGEASAEFQQELFDFAQYGVFEVAFEIAVVQAQKIEQIGAFQQQGGRRGMFLPQCLQFVPNRLFRLLGNRRAFE